MMKFTQDECNLMMLYSPGNLPGLCEALETMKEQLGKDETELRTLTDVVLSKLADIDEDAFDKLDLYPNF